MIAAGFTKSLDGYAEEPRDDATGADREFLDAEIANPGAVIGGG
jgi:hypothetical protein